MAKKLNSKKVLVNEEREPLPPTEPNPLAEAYAAGGQAYMSGVHNPPETGRERFAYFAGFFETEKFVTARNENQSRDRHR